MGANDGVLLAESAPETMTKVYYNLDSSTSNLRTQPQSQLLT